MTKSFTPIFRINNDGIDITDRFNDRVTQIEVTLISGDGNSDICTITLDDRDWRIASPVVGRKLEIYLGYKEKGLAQQNVFEIKTVEYLGPPRTIRITGTSVGFIGALKAPAIKDFDGKSLSDIVGDIAKKAGVSPMVEQGLGQIKVPFLNQTQSSLHLLQELERRYGALAKFDNGRLIFVPRDSYQSIGGQEMPTLLLRPEHLLQWSVRHDRRGEFSGVRAAYRDKDTHQPVWLEKENDKAATNDQGGSEKNPYRIPSIFNSKEEAEAGVASKLSALRRSLGEVNLTLSKGDPWIRDHMLMAISNMREGITGMYETNSVTHTYVKDQGILTSIHARPPGNGETVFDDDAGSDAKVISPKSGSKLGERFLPPVFDNA